MGYLSYNVKRSYLRFRGCLRSQQEFFRGGERGSNIGRLVKGSQRWDSGAEPPPRTPAKFQFLKINENSIFFAILMDISVIFAKFFEFLEQIWSKYRKVLGS